jgi:nitroimidazol reductase NimA-like FMN-containing flavoprotein (pyridoxamine 5'-phosphate oxidase superfamily)
MLRKVRIIRDIDNIEEELNNIKIGVLSYYNSDEEKVVQIATTFVYIDKNLYFILDSSEERFDNITPQTNLRFIIHRELPHAQDDEYYNYMEISCVGYFKSVDNKSLIDSICDRFNSKYSNCADKKNLHSLLKSESVKIVMLNTEEIQASEVSRG